MNRTLFCILLSLATTAQAVELVAAPQALKPAPVHAATAGASAELLTRFHYQAAPLDDGLSAKIFDRYLKILDPERIFFVLQDIDQFSSARTTLDDLILKQDLGLPFAIFSRYEERVRQRLGWAREWLARGFDFASDERYQYLRTDVPWAATEDELRDLWRKRVKNDWLRLKLAGKDDKAIRETLDKRYEHALTRAARTKSDDVFQFFMNAYANTIDPHTSYLGPRASEDFSIAMKLSLVGIGAVLQERDDYITIRELVAGGPAARSEQLAVGDRIVGVAEGERGTLVDVLGWRVDDVVGLIRGTKGSTVVLDILPAESGPDARHKRINLVRDTINLEKQAASKSLLTIGEGPAKRQIGVITLPTFYQDSRGRGDDSANYRSATRDIARLLAELRAENADAVLIDLRNNGGGSLDEAIRLTGLFIDTGPVVQQRDAYGQIRVEQDVDAGLAWDGPLGVLINRASASASEIFAAAIQDYGRGLVIGEQSFGKGTVQTLINLDEVVQNQQAKHGELKLTIAQFYRITGGSTQLRGVAPDIGLASALDGERFGESGFDNALPWTQIGPAGFKPAGSVSKFLPVLKLRHAERIAGDAGYRLLEEELAEISALRKRSEISLNEAARRKESAAQESRLKAREEARRAARGGLSAASAQVHGEAGPSLRDDGLLAEERSLNAELAAERSSKSARDVLLDESAHILGDLIEVMRGEEVMASHQQAKLR